MLKLSQTLFGFATRSFSMKANPVVAVVLSGCGVYDGSEVHEVSAVFVNLSRNDVAYNCFAPSTDQMHVINHTNGEVMSEKRNVMVESARISRGEITPLDKLSVEKFDAVIFPGGFGAAKNLSDFAVKNVDCTLNKNVEAVIKSFHSSNKPIGLCCISPVLAAKAIAGSEVTVGMDSTDDPKWPYAGTAGAINSMGGKHFNKNVQEVHVDKGNKIVTTPAYMCNTKVHEVHDGIAEMVKQLLKLI